MMKLSRFFLSRSADNIKTSRIKDSLWSHNSTSLASISTARENLVTDGKYEGRRFVDYPIFKGKAALSMYPVPPKFNKMNSGGIHLERRGVVMLTFWPAIGQRKYDWQKRQHFALSAVELGSLISLGPTDSCEFFHDPSMNTSLAGQVRKTFQVSPLSDDGGYYFNMSVVNPNQKINERFSVPVSKAEFAVMRTSFSYILPHIMGWDCFTSPQPETTLKVNPPKQPGPLLSPDLEWNR